MNKSTLVKIFLISFLALFYSKSNAQLFYYMSPNTNPGNWQSIASVAAGGDGTGTIAPITIGNRDDGWSSIVNYGFNFSFDNQVYSSFQANTNGYIKLDLAASALCTGFNSWSNDNTPVGSYGLDGPNCKGILAPFWDDLMLTSAVNGSDIYYSVTGPSGNKTLTIEWNQMAWHYFSTTASISFQIKMYEASGQIDFIYHRIGPSTNVNYSDAASPFGVSIGINSYNCAISNLFLSLSDCGTAPTVSSSVETYNIGRTTASIGGEARPAEGQKYSWFPPIATNDLVSNPVSLNLQTCTPYNWTFGTTENALDDEFMSPASCFDGGTLNDVWYTFVKPTGVTSFTISTDFLPTSCSSFSTQIALYTGSPSALDEVANPSVTYGNVGCNSSGVATINPNNGVINVTSCTTLATQYWVRVDGDMNTVGDFMIAVYSTNVSGSTCSLPSANTITGNFTENNTTACTINDYPTLNGTSVTGEDRVYKFIPTVSGQYEICVTQLDNFAQYTSTAPTSWENIGWWLTTGCPATTFVDTYVPGYTVNATSWGTAGTSVDKAYKASKVTSSLTAGTTYYLYIDTRSPVTNCQFSINVNLVVAGDNNGHLVTNAINANFLVNAGSFVIGTTYTIATLGTTSFTAIGAASNTVGLSFTATGPGAGTGTANISSQTFSGTTCCKGNDYVTMAGTSPFYMRGEDVIYKLTNMTASSYTITLTNTNSGGSPDDAFYASWYLSTSSTFLTVLDSAQSGTSSIATKTVTLAAGTTYYLLLDSWAYPICYSYTLDISRVTSICDAMNTINIPSLTSNQSFVGTLKKNSVNTGTFAAPTGTVGCTGTIGVYWNPPNSTSFNRVYKIPGSSVPTTGTYYINLLNTTGSPVAGGSGTAVAWAVYTNCLPTALNCIGGLSSGNTSVSHTYACGSVTLTAGTTYYLYVCYYGANSATIQSYNLEIGPNPIASNDLPTTATNLAFLPTTLYNESNLCASATGEPGQLLINESVQAGNAWFSGAILSQPVWYSFNAPTSGGVYWKIFTDGTINNPAVNVGYTALYHLADGVSIPRSIAITGVTTGSSTVTITANNHGFSNGDSVSIWGFGGLTNSPHGSFVVSSATVNTFQITVSVAPSGVPTYSASSVSNLLLDKASVNNQCNTSSNNPNVIGLDYCRSLVPGKKYYLRVAGGLNTYGFFHLYVDDINNVPAQSGADCGNPITVCNPVTVLPAITSFYGNYCDLTNNATSPVDSSGAFSRVEKSSCWVKFQTNGSAGNLLFTFTPIGTNQYNWILFDITGLSSNYCDLIQRGTGALSNTTPTNPTLLPINGRGITSICGLNYYSGISTTLNGSCGTSNFAWDFPVTTGVKTYLLVLYRNSNLNFPGGTLDFSGCTGGLSVGTPPTEAVWTGTTSSDWNTTSNWICSQAPSCNINVTIPSGCTNYPILTGSSTFTAKSITINSGAQLNVVDPNSILSVCGNFLNNGGILYMVPGSTLQMSGDVNQTIGGNLTSGNALGALKILQGPSATAATVTQLSDIDIKSDFWNASTAKVSTFASGANTINLEGNFTVTSPNLFTTTLGGSLQFVSSSSTPQTYDNTSADLNDVVINNTGAGVKLLTDMTLSSSGIFTPTWGKVDGTTNSKKVIVKNTNLAGSGAGNINSWVWGGFRKYLAINNHNIPVGNGNAWEGMSINVTSNTATWVDVNFSNQSQGTGFPILEGLNNFVSLISNGGVAPLLDFAGSSSRGVWTVVPNTGSFNYDITLNARNYATFTSTLTVARRPISSSPNNWVLSGTYVPATSTGTTLLTVSRTSMPSISESTDFGIATTVDVPLGIKLIEFGGRNINKKTNILSWLMGSEEDGDNFTIERKNKGGQFSKLGNMKGFGQTNYETQYSMIDDMPYEGINYYRLKISHSNGTFEYSKIVAIQNEWDGEFSVDLRPNPVSDKLTIDAVLPNSGNCIVKVFDLIGNSIIEKQFTVNKGYNPLEVEFLDKAPGIYFVKVEFAGKKFVSRVIKI